MIEQRKTVSVVFADLVESTSLAERLDPEVLATVLGRYFEALKRVVEKHGGTVEKFIGDAVVGVFGVPVLHEDDAVRAVRAAVEIHAAIDTLSAELQPSLGLLLAVRVGVNTGEVLVSGDNRLGHAISMAARLEQHAGAGEVLIGKQTYELVRDFVDATPVDELTVKGSSEPVHAWKVTDLTRSTGRRGTTAYVGRDRELAALAAAFELAAGAPASVTVTLVAPPGLGKSRLIDEAVTRLGERVRVLVGRCLPYGEAIAYAPLIEIVHQLEAEEGTDVLDRLLTPRQDGEQVVARVRATVTGAAHGSPDETAWAFRRLFEALAEQLPVVVVFDDIHWADPVLLDLIEYVGTFSVGKPILLLCATRPDLFEIRPGWSAPRENAQQIRLGPLTDAETANLIESVGDALDPAARQRIVETSGGVPLFVEQLAAFDVEVSGHAAIPPTMRALLAARVDRLTPDERAVLEAAAIQGQSFRRDDVAELMTPDARGRLGGQLMSLIRRDFVRPDPGVDGHDSFAFNHALIRDAVYEAMPKRSRATMHERYADVLEARGDVPSDVIAYHLDQAYRERAALGEGPERTIELARRAGAALAAAGRAATARVEPVKAIELLDRAEEVLAVDPQARAAVLPDLIDALVTGGEIDTAERWHSEAVRVARGLGDETTELRAEMAWAITEPRRDAAGWQTTWFPVIDRAVAHFEAIGDDASVAHALVLQALGLAPIDQSRAIAALKRALEFAQRSDNERVQVQVWDELGGAMLFGPTPFEETLAFTRREVEWARERGIAFSVADGRLGEAYSLAALGKFEGALEVIDELVEFFTQLPGRVSQHGECYTLAGRIERDRGRPDAAVVLYRKAMDLFELSGHRRWWRSAAPGVAHALLDQGLVGEARAVLDDISLHDTTDAGTPGAFRLEAEARYLAATGEAAAGVEVAESAVSAVAGTGAPLYEGRARETLAGVLAAAGDAERAADELRHARDLYAVKGFLPGVARIDALLKEGANGK